MNRTSMPEPTAERKPFSGGRWRDDRDGRMRASGNAVAWEGIDSGTTISDGRHRTVPPRRGCRTPREKKMRIRPDHTGTSAGSARGSRRRTSAPPPGRGPDLHRTTVGADDGVDDREAEPGAAVRLRAVAGREPPDALLQPRGREPGTVVAHDDHRVAAVVVDHDLDPVLRVAQRVLDEVAHRPLDGGGVAEHGGVAGDGANDR